MRRQTAVAVALGLAAAAPVAAAPAVAAAEPGGAQAGIEWHACGAQGAECGSVRVPLDWARPGERITLAVSRVRAADPARRIGVLFVNPGGPGGAAVPMVRDYAREVFPADLRDRFDIVGVDPRGVGESRPAITCPTPPFDPAVTQFPTTPEQYHRLVAHNRRVAEDCRRATGPLIDHVDTVSAARDFDAVRKAVGERRVSWLGLSYGTLLGTTYARLYPDRVRAAVFDGAVDHGIGSRRMAADEARVTEEVFARFAKWCAEDSTCALHGRDVVAHHENLLARAPLPATGVPNGIPAEQLGYGVYSGLYSPANWSRLAELLRDAETDAAPFAAASTDPAYRVIACHDFPSDVRDSRTSRRGNARSGAWRR
ncbi:hypothetical protein SUDANB95_02276 [Actinosynnema sp. ALI-1.44]